MNKRDYSSLITTRYDDPGGKKSSAIKQATALFAKEFDDKLDLVRIEDGEVNKIMASPNGAEKYKTYKSKKIYTQYLNLWTTFVADDNIKDGFDDEVLVRFFDGTKSR